MEVTHTPTPWHVIKGGNFTSIGGSDFELIVRRTGYLGHAVCDLGDWDGEKHNHKAPHVLANAAHIVKCVNEYQALCEVLEFAKHGGNCRLRDAFANDETKCSCGLDTALATLAALRKGEKV